MLKKSLFAGLITLFASTAAVAESLYINVDTRSLTGQSGWLDLQFNPGDVDAPPATAIITAIATDGSAIGAATLTGDASGGLGSTITLGNGAFLNDYLQGFAFGSTLSFTVDWNMPNPAPGATVAGSAFSLSFYDENFNSLLADPVWGATLVSNLNGDGTLELLAKSAPVSLSTTAPATVPEPGTVALLLAGIAMLAGARRSPPVHSQMCAA